MTKSESIAALAAALAKAQGAMKPAAFDSNNPFFKSRYASLPAIWESIRKPLSDNGLSIVQMPSGIENDKITVQTMLLHESGEWIATDYHAGVKPEKDGAQALGSIVTYLRRYSLAAIVGQVSDDDDDAESVTDHKPAAKAAPKSEPKAADAELTRKQKMLKAIGAQIWRREDESGEMVPDWHRIGKEMNDRAKGLGFELAKMTVKEADALVAVFNTILKEEELNGRGDLNGN